MPTALEQRILNRYHEVGKLGLFSGCIVVAKDAEVLASVQLGLADYAQNTPFSINTAFCIASLTKMFTAVCVLLLKEQGKLSLTDTIGGYLPEYARGAHVTIKQLLGHVSGVPEHTDKQAFWDLGSRIQSSADVFQFFKEMDMDWEAGSRYSYCNSNYVLLGMIIARISGKSYGDFLAEHIFRPLGMAHTAYVPQGSDFPETATGYEILYPQPITAQTVKPFIPFAAGGIYSGAGDLLLFSNALFGGQLLKPESLKEMLTVDREMYGLGIKVEKTEIAGRMYTLAGHNGGMLGYCSKIARVLETRHTIILLCNVDGPEQISISDYFAEVMTCVNAG